MFRRHSNCIIVILAAVCLAIALPGCDDDFIPTGSPELVLLRPFDPVPADGSVDLSGVVALNWANCNPLDSSVRYSVYFGSDDNPPLLVDSLTDTTYSITLSANNTTYYWRVVATNSAGACAKSPIWNFSFGDNSAFPLTVGNRWEYSYSRTYFNFDPDSLGENIAYEGYHHVSLEVTGTDTAVDGSEVSVITERVLFGDWVSESYFQNRSDGLYYYGFSDTGDYPIIAPFKSVSGADLEVRLPGEIQSVGLTTFLGGMPLAASNTGIESEGEPLQCLAYPLKIGQQWIFSGPDDNDAGWVIEKKVIDKVSVETEAGEFECYCVQWLWDRDGDGESDTDLEQYDYFCSLGLVKRVIIAQDLWITDYNTGEILGTVDLMTEYSLTEFELKQSNR